MSARGAAKRKTYSIREVAELLEWSESSVRRHLVFIDDWREKGGYRCGEVPCIPKGAQVRIPAWWVQRMLEMLDDEG